MVDTDKMQEQQQNLNDTFTELISLTEKMAVEIRQMQRELADLSDDE